MSHRGDAIAGALLPRDHALLRSDATRPRPPCADLSSGRVIADDEITVPMGRGRNAWLVFETKSGLIGIADPGECLPSASATELFDVTLTPSERPALTIQGMKTGTGELLLVVGAVTDGELH